MEGEATLRTKTTKQTKSSSKAKRRATTTKGRTIAAKPKAGAKPDVQAQAEDVRIEENLAVYGVYAGMNHAETGFDALTAARFPEASISTSSVRPVEAAPRRIAPDSVEAARTGYAATTARMAGSMLALGSAALLAPVLLAGPVLAAVFGTPGANTRPDGPAMDSDNPILMIVNCNRREDATRALRIMEASGAVNTAIADLQAGADDLKRREYRDASGAIHHHTRTYIQAHAE
jgi:hypothetical protein